MWVALKRARGWDWIGMLRRYSVLERSQTPRAREVRSMPWGDVAGAGRGFNARWRAVRQLVEDFAAARVPDPCPRAQHWGGRGDSPKPGMVPAKCAAETENTFYAMARRPR